MGVGQDARHAGYLQQARACRIRHNLDQALADVAVRVGWTTVEAVG